MRSFEIRKLLPVALVLLPASVYGIIRYHAHGEQQTAIARGRRDKQAWAEYLIERKATRSGFQIGRVFPQLPTAPPTGWVGAIGGGKPTIVSVMSSIRQEADLPLWKKLLDRAPGTTLLIATEDLDGDTEARLKELADPRISYVVLPKRYCEQLNIYGGRMVYSLDGKGVIRKSRLIPFRADARTLDSLLVATGQS